MKIIDGLRKYDDEDLRIAAQLLHRMEWDVKFAADLLVYAEAMRELLGLDAPSEKETVLCEERKAVFAERLEEMRTEQQDANWFYKGMSNVSSEQICR